MSNLDNLKMFPNKTGIVTHSLRWSKRTKTISVGSAYYEFHNFLSDVTVIFTNDNVIKTKQKNSQFYSSYLEPNRDSFISNLTRVEAKLVKLSRPLYIQLVCIFPCMSQSFEDDD